MTASEEQDREAALLDAQDRAASLFDEIAKDLVKPGILESDLSKQIHQLGEKRHGVRTHRHKRVVRSGPNTLKPYAEDPPDRVIEEDDILFVDLCPVFEAWEADFGRTFVLGHDETKIPKVESRDRVTNLRRLNIARTLTQNIRIGIYLHIPS